MSITSVTQNVNKVLVWVVGGFFILALFFVAAKELGLIEWYYEAKALKEIKKEELKKKLKKKKDHLLKSDGDDKK